MPFIFQEYNFIFKDYGSAGDAKSLEDRFFEKEVLSCFYLFIFSCVCATSAAQICKTIYDSYVIVPFWRLFSKCLYFELIPDELNYFWRLSWWRKHSWINSTMESSMPTSRWRNKKAETLFGLLNASSTATVQKWRITSQFIKLIIPIFLRNKPSWIQHFSVYSE